MFFILYTKMTLEYFTYWNRIPLHWCESLVNGKCKKGIIENETHANHRSFAWFGIGIEYYINYGSWFIHVFIKSYNMEWSSIFCHFPQWPTNDETEREIGFPRYALTHHFLGALYLKRHGHWSKLYIWVIWNICEEIRVRVLLYFFCMNIDERFSESLA